MQRIKALSIKAGEAIAAFALVLGTVPITKACLWWFHQPEVPDQLKKCIKKD